MDLTKISKNLPMLPLAVFSLALVVMDSVQVAGQVSSVGSLLMMVGYAVYKICKHSKCRSKCFGVESSLSVDLDEDAKESPMITGKTAVRVSPSISK